MKTEFCHFTMPLNPARIELRVIPAGCYIEVPAFDCRYNLWVVERYDEKEDMVLCRCVHSRVYEKGRLLMVDASKRVRTYGAPIFKGVDK